jgi:2-haloalkanoic acid dehalogenase type II
VYRALLFDLLTALEDSWTLWNDVAGSPERGHRWRQEYLRLTYGQGPYVDYEHLVKASAQAVGEDPQSAAILVRRWPELKPWPRVVEGLAELRQHYRLAVVTNCSETLGLSAARLVGDFDTVVTAQRAGYYKPHPAPYQLALAELGVAPAEALFVAGSPSDLAGAANLGMPVVWHNQLRLKAPPTAPQPLFECADFPTLLSWLRQQP